jgi:hypothetical protein
VTSKGLHRDYAAAARRYGWLLGFLTLFSFAVPRQACAATMGRLQGKVVAADSNEPIGFADVVLVPADTTQHKIGGLTNADGTFLLQAPAGRYLLEIRALSYARKTVEGIVIQAGQLTPFQTSLTAEAIQQQEVVVEAKARHDSEASLLAARKKAVAIGDAVSAEQVKKSPDKDAAEVLRRVTGLSVSDGKYVFVRGLGERYSSTEVDGVRIASPEQNKRVVPLDLFPAQLLDNVVVQKTYTADRPGEFGGGDVQVHTRDFPGARSWSYSVSQGYADQVTFRNHQTYEGTRADLLGFGADFRGIPDAVFDVAGGRPLTQSNDPSRGFTRKQLSTIGASFRDVWSARSALTPPNGSYSLTYGDEVKLFGRSLGVIQSWSMSRSFDDQREAQRFFPSPADTLYDYAVRRSRETVQLGGISGLSLRLSPAHALHLRGLYTNSADDEVRTYQGPDHNRIESTTGAWLVHRDTRLMYVERSVASGTLEGEHELRHVLDTHLNWSLTRSGARRQQPDRRETTYDQRFYDDGTGNLVSFWALGSIGSREFGDLRENGWGGNARAWWPFQLFGMRNGKLSTGFDRQIKDRKSFYRRFNFNPHDFPDRTAPPESIFASSQFDSTPSSAYVVEATLNQDNYRAHQAVNAGFLSVDLPLLRSLRATAGLRVERAKQDVRSFDLFNPLQVTAHGGFEDTDWLPSANLTWAVTEAMNVRLAGSRTLSRPDLNELSPSPSLEYVGGFLQAGNPDLHRARIDNYDLRVEAFPGLSELLAAGVFYKRLYDPIEQTIIGGAPPLLIPRNSESGRNLGLELEARAGLGRLTPWLSHVSFNANASFISTRVQLPPQISKLGSEVHPLQGQAQNLVNAALSYTSGNGARDATVLFGATGRRLAVLGLFPQPDVYAQPSSSLDATASFGLFGGRLKLGARNLTNPKIRQLQGEEEVSSDRDGRSYSIALSFGS